MGADTWPDGDALGSEPRAQPREKNGRFATNAMGSGLTDGSGSGNLQSSPDGVSATGANKFEKGFSKKNLDRHWKGRDSDHSAEYPALTKEEYANRALALAQSKADGKNILGYATKQGAVVRYDVKANDYVKGYPKDGIATMFKPSAGQRYFDSWKKREG